MPNTPVKYADAKVPLSASVPRRLLERLKAQAAADGVSVSAIVQRAIERELDGGRKSWGFRLGR